MTSGGVLGTDQLDGMAATGYATSYRIGSTLTTGGAAYNELGSTFYSGTNISSVGRVMWPIFIHSGGGSPISNDIVCRVWTLNSQSGTSKSPDALLGTSGQIDSAVTATSEGSPNNRYFDFATPVSLTANTWYGISIRYPESSTGFFNISANNDATSKSNLENGGGAYSNYFSDTNSNDGDAENISWQTGTAGSHPAKPSCLLYTSPSPRDLSTSRMPSSA